MSRAKMHRHAAPTSRLAAGLALALVVAPDPGAAQDLPSILVSTDWLAGNRDASDLVLVHVAITARGEPDRYIDGARLLDYSTVAAERNGLPVEMPPIDSLVEALAAAGIGDSTRVVAYGTPAHLPARLVLALEYLGMGGRAAVLDGGLEVWSAEGRPVASAPAPPPGRAATLTPDPRTDLFVTADWIEGRLGDPAVALIDARPEVEYTGERPGRDYLRGGHVPGAYNLYWQDLVESPERPRLRSLDEVRARFATAGADEADHVVSYCLIGMRASYTWVISRLLGYDARFYDPSWAEWGARDDLPLVAGASRN